MGRELLKLEAWASVSKHNSIRDDIDAEDWNDFVRDVKRAAERGGLDIDVMAPEANVVGWKA